MNSGFLKTQGFQIKDFQDLMNLKTLDYSQKRILSSFHQISLFLLAETYDSLLSVRLDDPWVAQKIKTKKMLDLFEIASGNESDVYKALLFCYAHQGSTKGIYQLVRALFGENAHIQMEIHPNQLDITTDIDNINFIKALTTGDNKWLTSHQQEGFIAETFEKIGTSQMAKFLQGFMNPAKKLTLTIIH